MKARGGMKAEEEYMGDARKDDKKQGESICSWLLWLLVEELD